MQTPTADRPDPLKELEQKVAYAEQVKQINNQIHSAKDLDHILVDLKDEILKILDAEVLTLYVVDAERREIYSKYLDINKIHEIRVPISEQSIAGFVAKYRRPVNIADAYNKAELNAINPSLAFDSSWDKRSGLRTKQILTYPVVADNKYLMGVIQLVNKKGGGQFTKKDEESVAEISKTLGIAFFNQLKLSRKIPTKFDSLVANSKLTKTELDAAVGDARKQQVDVETVLLEKYRVSKQEIGRSMSQFYRCPFVEFDGRLTADPDLLRDLNIDHLKSNFWIPLKREKDGIQVLIDDPNNLTRIQDIKRTFPGRSIQFAVGLRQDILQFISAGSRTPDTAVSEGASLADPTGALASEVEQGRQEGAHAREVNENEEAIVRLADQIITDAYTTGASDIHIEPYGEKRECVVRFRMDGSCREHRKIPAAYRQALVSRYKGMSGLDVAERRKPQAGKIAFRLGNKEIELRMATIPTTGLNEDVVIHILPACEAVPIDKLWLSERNLREIKRIAERPTGIILCAGPAGSGRTTSLHALLGHVTTPERKVCTAEDPVEITQDGMRQVQVNPGIGFTFAAATRALLRADPDVIMIGELDGKETCEAGIEAALAGHVVFGALHANCAVDALTRLLEMGLDPIGLADAILGVLAQRMCKTICKDCKQAYHPSKEEYDELAFAYGIEAFENLGYRFDDTFMLNRGRGCQACNGSGLKGRMGLQELLIGTDRIKRAIRKQAAAEELLKIALEDGMTTLIQDGIVKVIQGGVTLTQVKAVTVT